MDTSHGQPPCLGHEMVHLVEFDLFRLFTLWTNPTSPIGPSKLAPVHLHSPSWSHPHHARTWRTDREEYYCEIQATTWLVAVWMLNLKLETIKSINQISMILSCLHWGWRRDSLLQSSWCLKADQQKRWWLRGKNAATTPFLFILKWWQWILFKKKNTTKNTEKTCKDTAFDPFPPQNWTKEPPNSLMTIGQKIIFQPLEQTLDGSNYS